MRRRRREAGWNPRSNGWDPPWSRQAGQRGGAAMGPGSRPCGVLQSLPCNAAGGGVCCRLQGQGPRAWQRAGRRRLGVPPEVPPGDAAACCAPRVTASPCSRPQASARVYVVIQGAWCAPGPAVLRAVQRSGRGLHVTRMCARRSCPLRRSCQQLGRQGCFAPWLHASTPRPRVGTCACPWTPRPFCSQNRSQAREARSAAPRHTTAVQEQQRRTRCRWAAEAADCRCDHEGRTGASRPAAPPSSPAVSCRHAPLALAPTGCPARAVWGLWRARLQRARVGPGAAQCALQNQCWALPAAHWGPLHSPGLTRRTALVRPPPRRHAGLPRRVKAITPDAGGAGGHATAASGPHGAAHGCDRAGCLAASPASTTGHHDANHHHHPAGLRVPAADGRSAC